MSSVVCRHGCSPLASCPICASIEDQPRGLYQFASTPVAYGEVFDPLANAQAALGYMAERYGLSSRGLVVGSLEEYRRVFGERPVIFDELRRWKSPWWARAVAWAIAAYYALRR